MSGRHLLCPPCGGHRFFVDGPGGPRYFHVGPDRRPFPTEASRSDLGGFDFSAIRCTGCSWSGHIRKLTAVFCA